MKMIRTKKGEVIFVGAIPGAVRIVYRHKTGYARVLGLGFKEATTTYAGTDTAHIDLNAFYAEMLGNHLLRAAEDLRMGRVAKEKCGDE